MEVVQQIGSDSFAPGHGVLIGKSKTGSSTCGYLQLLRLVHRLQPAGHRPGRLRQGRRHAAKATPGDERQLNDGTFNVGVNSGGEYEYVADANKLHFYILDKRTDAAGRPALQGRRPLDRRRRPADARRAASAQAVTGTAEGFTTCTFPLKNTGAAAATPGHAHPQDASAYLDSDIYRLSASTRPPAGRRTCKNALATAKFGETVQVPVYIEKAAGAAASGSVTLTATSESDPSKTLSRDLRAPTAPSAAPSRPRWR